MTKNKNFGSPSSRIDVITTHWKTLIEDLKVLSCEDSTAPQDFKWEREVLADAEDQKNRDKSTVRICNLWKTLKTFSFTTQE